MITRSIIKKCLPVVFVLLALVGCDDPDVEIVISPEYQSATIQIDFVKVQRSEMAVWTSMNIDDYFSPGSQFRDFAKQRGDIFTVYYNVPQKTFKGSIRSDDPVWERVEYERGVEQSFDVIVLADIPGVTVYTPLSEELSSGLVAYDVAGKKAGEVVKTLHDNNIITSASPYRTSYPRFAPSLLNNEAEIDRALEVVAGMA